MFDTEPVDTEEMEPMRGADDKTYNATEDGQPPAAAPAPAVQVRFSDFMIKRIWIIISAYNNTSY